MAYENLVVFTGNANPLLAHNVVKRLNIPIGHAVVGKFSDGEVMVEILENVRGKDVFVLQSTCMPTNDNLMELLVMVDALRRASAGRITAAMPYYGYARQDRRPSSARVAIDYPIGHRRRRAEGIPVLIEKFRRNLATRFDGARSKRIEAACSDQDKLEALPVDEFMALWVGQ